MCSSDLDKYVNALPPFAFLLDRHWPQHPEVIVGGFTAPSVALPSGWQFHSIGKMEDYPVERWSNALIRMLLELQYDVFLLMLEDYWLTRPVDHAAFQICADYMHQFEYVARFDLTADRKYSGFAKPYGRDGHVKLIISDPESQYHCSLMAALWRRAHMLKILVENESPWDVEIKGTPRLRALQNYCIVLGTEDPPMHHTLAFRGGDNHKLLLDDISPADVADMREAGLLRPWEKANARR